MSEENKNVFTSGEEPTSTPTPSLRKQVLIVVAVALAAALLASLLLWVLVFREGGAPAVSSSLPVSSLRVVSSSSRPQPEPDPEPEAPQLAFTAEEEAELDSMLDQWAAAVTAELPVPEEGEEATVTAANYGHRVSVYYQDLDSGLTYTYNDEQKYPIASLNKAPYAVYVYLQIEAGKANLSDTIHVTPGMVAPYMDNSGRMKNDDSLPRDYTVDELIYELIRYSDTAALKILMGRFGTEGYAEWAAGLGLAHPEDVREVTNGRITAGDAGIYMCAVYEYIETGVYGAQLKEHMLNTTNPMITSQYPVVRKYGWDKGAYHDMAVVYADHRYILVILTDKSMGSWGETAKFATIARTFEDIVLPKHEAWEAGR